MSFLTHRQFEKFVRGCRRWYGSHKNKNGVALMSIGMDGFAPHRRLSLILMQGVDQIHLQVREKP